MKNGFVKLHRVMRDSKLWSCTPDTIKLAIYLLLEARHDEQPKKYPGVTINRGEIVTSLSQISDGCAWFENRVVRKWSRQKISRMLTILQDISFLSVIADTHGTHISVCNYDKYQPLNKDNSDTHGTRMDINKNVKNEKEIYCRVVDHLNQKTGKVFKPTSNKTKALINARLNDGFKLEDFIKVIDNKTAQWVDDPKMSNYLRPETLFGTKFESYLNDTPKTNGCLPKLGDAYY